MLTTGTLLKERYAIDSVLGEGGMSAVYLAFDRSLGGKKVAVKQMQVQIARADDRAKAIAQFRNEAHLLASLEHPRLVPVTDFFEDGESAYLVMGLVDGRTLLDASMEPGVTLADVVGWIDQIADVLEYLHGRQPPVLFRDLKPSNVMLDCSGQIRLIDFGIARTFETGQTTGTFLKGAGTAEFAPVEQFSGKGGTDVRSDIYSLGATMYDLMTSELPPVSVDVMAGEVPPPNPRHVNPAIPPPLEAIMLKAMALRKDERYPAVRELRQALSQVPRALLNGSNQPQGAPPAPQGTPQQGPETIPPSSDTRPGNSPTQAPSQRTDTLPSAGGQTLVKAAALAPNPALPPTLEPWEAMPTAQGEPAAAKGMGLVYGAATVLLTMAAAAMLVRPAPPPRVASASSSPAARPSTTITTQAPPPQRATPQRVALATLVVESQTAGALVKIDGDAGKQAPRSVSLPPGAHRISIERPGYAPYTKTLLLSGGQSQNLVANLQPAKAATATKTIIDVEPPTVTHAGGSNPMATQTSPATPQRETPPYSSGQTAYAGGQPPTSTHSRPEKTAPPMGGPDAKPPYTGSGGGPYPSQGGLGEADDYKLRKILGMFDQARAGNHDAISREFKGHLRNRANEAQVDALLHEVETMSAPDYQNLRLALARQMISVCMSP